MSTKLKIAILAGLLAGTSSVFADSSYLDSAGAMQSDSAAQEQNSIGMAFSYSQDVYDGVGNKTQPFPLLNLTYNDFFIKGVTLGYNAYTDDSFSFALIAQPQFGGYSSGDSNELAGMDDTSYLVNTGVQAQYRLMPFSFTVAALHDVSGRTGGNSASAKMAVMVPLDDQRFVLIPSISATWESSDITDYYYGVSSSEATSSRPEYSPSSAINIGYGLTLKYRMSEHWGATFGYVLTQYSDDVSDSPIVSRQYNSAVLAGMSYLF